MSLRLSDKSVIKKVLLISLTNIGDVILTFPVIDILKKEFPSAKLSVVTGPKAEPLLRGNPYLHRVHIFDKHQSSFKLMGWIRELTRERFDLAVDLRNTAIPFMIFPRYRTSCFVRRENVMHMRDQHLQRLKSVYLYAPRTVEKCALFITKKDENYVDQLVEGQVGTPSRYIVIAPGAADQAKRWPGCRVASVCDQLIEKYNVKIVFAGGRDDAGVIGKIKEDMVKPSVNFCGRLTLTQLAALFKGCRCALVNDSAPMHLASYLDVPVVALFGPTDPRLYGPWSRRSYFLRNNQACPKCQHPKKSFQHICMNAITEREVLQLFDRHASTLFSDHDV